MSLKYKKMQLSSAHIYKLHKLLFLFPFQCKGNLIYFNDVIFLLEEYQNETITLMDRSNIIRLYLNLYEDIIINLAFGIHLYIKLMISNPRSGLQKADLHNQIELIKLSIQQVHSLSKHIISLSTSFGSRKKQEAQDRIELAQIEIKQKIKNVAFNIDEMVALIDYKLSIITAYLIKVQKSGSASKNLAKSNISSSSKTKNQVDYTYQIKQLEDRICDHQLRQKDSIQQIQQLKQKNKKLMEEFSKLSIHSNKKIVELSEQLYNNTSPNLTIRGRNLQVENPEMSYIASQRNQAMYNRRENQNIVKNKFSPLQNQYKKPTANILSGLVSEQSSFDKDFGLEQSSTQGLRFGCIPTKNNTQKTKTGSSSINKKQSLQQRSDKKRRFDFLLNNLNKQSSNATNIQQARFYGSQCESYKQQKSVFQSNVVKRYQI